jgi:hypothetical protein
MSIRISIEYAPLPPERPRVDFLADFDDAEAAAILAKYDPVFLLGAIEPADDESRTLVPEIWEDPPLLVPTIARFAPARGTAVFSAMSDRPTTVSLHVLMVTRVPGDTTRTNSGAGRPKTRRA